MKRVIFSPLEKRVEKKFQEAKKRAEIRERYGVLTQKMFEDLLDKKLEEKLDPIKKKLQNFDEKMDWLIGKYSAHDEEHTLLNNKVSEHSDQLEVINTKLGIQA